jgi:hypothetical protein
MLRHGSRYPSTKQFEKSKKFLDAVAEYRSKQRKSDQPIKQTLLDEIQLTFENEPHYRLSELGANEMRSIAKRFRSRYPTLFNRTSVLSPLETAKSMMSLISSDRDRSIQSGHHFLRGLYEIERNANGNEATDDEQHREQEHSDKEYENIAEYLTDRIDVNNRMMRLFDECDKYAKSIKKNESAYTELIKFKNGKEMQTLIENFKRRHDIENLDIDAGS